LLDGINDAGFVVGVGDSEPRRGGGEDFAAGLAFAHKLIDHARNVAFGFGSRDLVFEEGGEVLFGLGEVSWAEAPEVHGDDVVCIHEAFL